MADALFLDDLHYSGDRLRVSVYDDPDPENEKARPVYIEVRERGVVGSVGLTLGQVAELVGVLAMAISNEQTRRINEEPDLAARREETRAAACRLAREKKP